jgi:hypothetical protein
MQILFLHGWQSTPGGLKPTYLKDHGHSVFLPKLPDDDFDDAVRIAQAEFDRHHPDVVVGSSRGGAVAMNINSGLTPLVLLCPAWKRWGSATTVKPGTIILHSKSDEVVPFSDSVELARNSDLPSESLVDVGTEHRLADEESLKKMLEAVEKMASPKATQSELVEYAVVRVARLLRSDRSFQGTEGVRRPPQVGDIGTIVHVYDLTLFAVECVDGSGMTVWLADFFADELEVVKD